MKKISLPIALAWIVGSTFLISGGTYSVLTAYQRWQYRKIHDAEFQITTIVQTGPQKEALKTVYLAELMRLSCDRPLSIYQFDRESAQRALLASPVIKEAHVEIEKPNRLFVDYTVRQPCAILADFDNIAIDEEGCLFPLHPFFAPKNLMQIYLGIGPFGVDGVYWHTPLRGSKMALAFDLLHLLQPIQEGGLHIERIDLSRSDFKSYGQREIVVIAVDEVFFKGKSYPLRRILRLSEKDYAAQLGNYLKLRKELLQEDQLKIEKGETVGEMVIDLRLSRLGYIQKG